MLRSHPGYFRPSPLDTHADTPIWAHMLCRTSANAKKIIEALGVPRVIMLPDEYLARNTAAQTSVEIIAWKGHCEVHERFTAADIRSLRESHPSITVLAHPECPPEVIAECDFTGSTAAMADFVGRKRPPMASGHARLRRAVSLLTYAPVAHCEGPMPFSKVTGDLPKIIANQERIYEGNLTFYFRTLFFKSSNIHNPYHNFRHMLHVLWLCHQACRYYQNRLTPRQMRNLLIAALFHDFDHPGHPHPGENDPDRINIPIAIAGLRRYVMPADRAFLPQIEALIEATHYPYKIGSDKLDLLGQIIRDADLAQALSPAWIQQVVFGLAQEWEVSPLEVLKRQGSFLASLSFSTGWAPAVSPGTHSSKDRGS